MDEAHRVVDIEFLYLDLSSCGPCVASDAGLREAITVLTPVFERVGVRLSVRSVHVISEEQARVLHLVSSPTIRVNGTDIAGELVEAECGDCTAQSAVAAPVTCRVWRWRGQQYAQAPAGLIIDAVLHNLYRQIPPIPAQAGYVGLPGNLAQFFGASAAVGNLPNVPRDS